MDSRVDDVVVSTRIRFARNVKGLPFPKRLSGQEEIYSVLMKGVKEACDELFKTKFYKMCDIDELLAQSYVEKHLISNDLVKNVNFGALAVNEDEDISVMINEEDHIREQCVTEGFDLDGAYKKLLRVDEKIAEKLDIAFDPKFGYLTACPTNLGAAMRASVMVFLPALTLTKKINTLINDLQRLDFTTRGVYGEGSGAQGFMYQISNQATVGKSEEDIIKLVKKTILPAIGNELVKLGKQPVLPLVLSDYACCIDISCRLLKHSKIRMVLLLDSIAHFFYKIAIDLP